MEQQIFSFDVSSAMYLAAMMAAALFFGLLGYRDNKETPAEGNLYLGLAVLCFVAHFYYLANLPDNTEVGSSVNMTLFAEYLTKIIAPALATLSVLMGIFNCLATQNRVGLLKVALGVGLVAMVLVMGADWQIYVKGLLTVVIGMVWFDFERRTVQLV